MRFLRKPNWPRLRLHQLRRIGVGKKRLPTMLRQMVISCGLGAVTGLILYPLVSLRVGDQFHYWWEPKTYSIVGCLIGGMAVLLRYAVMLTFTHRAYFRPRRSWLRFSLRTMFVIMTLFSLWLGWQAKIVRDRRELRTELQLRGGTVLSPVEADKVRRRVYGKYYKADPAATVPFWRRWMGDEPIQEIHIDGGPHYKRAEQLFPEAEVRPYPGSAAPVLARGNGALRLRLLWTLCDTQVLDAGLTT